MTQQIQHGVDSGCDAAADGSTLNISVSAGSVIHTNNAASVSAQTVVATSGDGTYDRYDIVTSDSAGNLTAVLGTPGANPIGPDTGDVRLWGYYVRAGATSVATADMQDLRVTVLRHVSPYRVSGLWYGAPSLAAANVAPTAFAMSSFNNVMILVPFFTAKQMSITNIGIEVSFAASAGSKARLGVYSDDGAGNLTLLIDAGQVAIDATGDQSEACSSTMTPGWYWFACAFQSASGTPNIYAANVSGFSPAGAASLSQAATNQAGGIKFTGISGALPTNPSSPDFSSSKYPAVFVKAA